MKRVFGVLVIFYLLLSCNRKDGLEQISEDNPEILMDIPPGFPALNPSVNGNKPTKFGVELGEKLFHEK